MSIPSQVLLAVCVFLFLNTGADARLCIHCKALTPGVPCRHSLCEVDDEGTCVGYISYRKEKFISRRLTCEKKEAVQCDTPVYLPEDFVTELKCCDNTDFCNASF